MNCFIEEEGSPQQGYLMQGFKNQPSQLGPGQVRVGSDPTRVSCIGYFPSRFKTHHMWGKIDGLNHRA